VAGVEGWRGVALMTVGSVGREL